VALGIVTGQLAGACTTGIIHRAVKYKKKNCSNQTISEREFNELMLNEMLKYLASPELGKIRDEDREVDSWFSTAPEVKL
jgi:hypothetical protein